MYGATIRIKAVMFNYQYIWCYHSLHSHLVNYPRGSGLQSITGFVGDNDYNSLWTIKEPHRETVKTYCNFLLNQTTNSSAAIPSVSNTPSPKRISTLKKSTSQWSPTARKSLRMESVVMAIKVHYWWISDDNWVLSCLHKEAGELFYGEDIFELIHENSERRVKMSRYYQYSHMNWENCPFEGQL